MTRSVIKGCWARKHDAGPFGPFAPVRQKVGTNAAASRVTGCRDDDIAFLVAENSFILAATVANSRAKRSRQQPIHGGSA
jgi:hypothetical protein